MWDSFENFFMSQDTFVIVDAGAFIHKQRLDTLESKLYTTSGILKEVRDPASRRHVSIMPANVIEKVPTVEDIRIVRDFATKSGDVGFLSSNDIAIIALANAVARENGVTLRSAPVTNSHQAAAQIGAQNYTWTPEKRVIKGDQPMDEQLDLEDSDSQISESESESDDGEGGWVTPENYADLKSNVAGVSTEVESARVSVMSGDYSVQNVCLQMGLGVLSYENLRIRSVKQWGLLCVACWGLTRDTQKAFCPKCGNDSIRRVSVLTNAEGEVTLAGGRPRRPQLKGTIFSIPKHRGGRDPNRPIFAEDEIYLGGRDRDLRRRQKQFEKELEERLTLGNDEGFGFMNGISAGAPKLVAGYGRRNQNANNFKRPGAGRRK